MMSKIGEYVSKRIDILSKQKDTPSGRARLARLRCGVGKTPGELPELWGEFLSDLPEDMLSRDGVPTQGEWAIYLALTLYALHQQGSSDIVHKKGEGLGRATATSSPTT